MNDIDNVQTSSEIMCTSISLFHRTEQCACSVDGGQTIADNILPSKFNFHKILNHEPGTAELASRDAARFLLVCGLRCLECRQTCLRFRELCRLVRRQAE